VKATILYRISSVLLLLFAAEHTFGLCQNNLMRSVHFDAQGFIRTYWDFFSAFGLFFSVFLLFAAVLAWLLGGLQHCVGARHLLCNSQRFELEIRLHHPHSFLNPDYSVFDCGRVALSDDRPNLDTAHLDWRS
jgi:succinate dehydrogenase/fumarate reductase cytochrome b subunit